MKTSSSTTKIEGGKVTVLREDKCNCEDRTSWYPDRSWFVVLKSFAVAERARNMVAVVVGETAPAFGGVFSFVPSGRGSLEGPVICICRLSNEPRATRVCGRAREMSLLEVRCRKLSGSVHPLFPLQVLPILGENGCRSRKSSYVHFHLGDQGEGIWVKCRNSRLKTSNLFIKCEEKSQKKNLV